MKNASSLLTALNEPIYELDLDGHVLAATASAFELIAEQARAQHGDDFQLDKADTTFAFASLISNKERSRFSQAIKRIADSKISQTTLEITILPANALEGGVPMEAKLSVITGLNGKPAGIALLLRDLSLEKASEAAANVQGTHLLDLVENVSDACIVESADGNVEMINDAFCRLFGIKEAPQSMVGIRCAALFETASQATEKRIGPVYFPLDVIPANDQRDVLDFALTTGEHVVQTTLAVDGETGLAGRMHLFHRATTNTASPHEKHSAGIVAAQMTLIEKIARELVVVLEGAASAALRAEQLDMPGQILQHFQRVEVAANAAFDTVAGLLDFSRIEGGDIDLTPTTFQLRENIAVLMANVTPHAEKQQVQLRLRIEQDVPDNITGDSARLMLALKNLLDCSLSTMPLEHTEGKLSELSLVISPEYEADNQIHLIFSVEPQIRSGKLRPPTPSAVMQLALARQIVRALVNDEEKNEGKNEGKIESIEKKTGVTYSFTVAFPFSPAKPHKPRPTFVTLSSLPVLIVSSDADERKQLADWMKSWRMLPREADNATMAMQLLTRMSQEGHPIPLIVCANQLPIQDGFMLAFRVKQHPQLKHTAVIMLATGGKPGDAIMCRENGVSAYLRQPVAPQQLNEAITAVIGAQDDNEATTTLITRHSLRESKKASVLIIDPANDQAMFAAAGLKKRDYRVVVASVADEAFTAMVQEEFDVIVVDPDGSGFAEGADIIDLIRENVTRTGASRPQPKILLATESPPTSVHGFDGFVLKPFAKDSLVLAVADLLPQPAKP